MYASLGNKNTNKALSLVIHLICWVSKITVYVRSNYKILFPPIHGKENFWNKHHFNWLNWQILLSHTIMSLVCATNFLHSKKSSTHLELGESIIAFQSPCIQALLCESNKQLYFYVDGQQWFCCYQYAVHNKGQTCPLGPHCHFLPSIFYCMWSPYTLRYTWCHGWAKRK